jgi:DNA-binding Lrp family transcriptional regulator
MSLAGYAIFGSKSVIYSKIKQNFVDTKEMVFEKSSNSKNIFPELDEVDLAILRILSVDGRISNAELADRVGVSASTSLTRTRALVDQGVITGFQASVNPAAVGLTLEALISVSLRAGARSNLSDFMRQMQELPQVVQVFFLGGNEDFIVHLAVKNSEEVREFVLDQLSNNASVASTRTNLIFAHTHRGPLG